MGEITQYSYFPGCTLKTKARDLDRYARSCAAKLGAELVEPAIRLALTRSGTSCPL